MKGAALRATAAEEVAARQAQEAKIESAEKVAEANQKADQSVKETKEETDRKVQRVHDAINVLFEEAAKRAEQRVHDAEQRAMNEISMTKLQGGRVATAEAAALRKATEDVRDANNLAKAAQITAALLGTSTKIDAANKISAAPQRAEHDVSFELARTIGDLKEADETVEKTREAQDNLAKQIADARRPNDVDVDTFLEQEKNTSAVAAGAVLHEGGEEDAEFARMQQWLSFIDEEEQDEEEEEERPGSKGGDKRAQAKWMATLMSISEDE